VSGNGRLCRGDEHEARGSRRSRVLVLAIFNERVVGPGEPERARFIRCGASDPAAGRHGAARLWHRLV